jgi:hypothetical protein
MALGPAIVWKVLCLSDPSNIRKPTVTCFSKESFLKYYLTKFQANRLVLVKRALIDTRFDWQKYVFYCLKKVKKSQLVKNKMAAPAGVAHHARRLRHRWSRRLQRCCHPHHLHIRERVSVGHRKNILLLLFLTIGRPCDLMISRIMRLSGCAPLPFEFRRAAYDYFWIKVDSFTAFSLL